jgi:hypothetical protein
VCPGLARVHGFVDAVAVGGIAADSALAGADVDDVGIGGSDRDRGDGAEAYVAVGDGLPVVAAVGGFEYAAAGSAEVVDEGLAGDAADGIDASAAEGSDLAEGESVKTAGWARRFRRRLRGGSGRLCGRRGRMLCWIFLRRCSQSEDREGGGETNGAAEREGGED